MKTRASSYRIWRPSSQGAIEEARAIYGMLPEDARLWQSGQRFVLIDAPRIATALAA